MTATILRTWLRGAIGLVCALLIGAASASSQPQQPEAPQPTPAPPPAPTTLEPPGKGYTYSADSRRDPFLSLLGRVDTRAGRARPEGLAGLTVNEATVKGILSMGGVFTALLAGPDGRTFSARAGAKLFDGTVKGITTDAVVFLQEVDNPLSLLKQREVKKPLRASEEGK